MPWIVTRSGYVLFTRHSAKRRAQILGVSLALASRDPKPKKIRNARPLSDDEKTAIAARLGLQYKPHS